MTKYQHNAKKQPFLWCEKRALILLLIAKLYRNFAWSRRKNVKLLVIELLRNQRLCVKWSNYLTCIKLQETFFVLIEFLKLNYNVPSNGNVVDCHCSVDLRGRNTKRVSEGLGNNHCVTYGSNDFARRNCSMRTAILRQESPITCEYRHTFKSFASDTCIHPTHVKCTNPSICHGA